MFSARGVPEGKFSMSGVLRDLPGSKLFFNCEKNSWFLDIEDDIRAKIAEYDHPNRLFVGTSMGGAAAMMFGQQATRILAFSPNTVVGEPFTHSALYVQGVRRDVTEGIDPATTTMILGIYDPADVNTFVRERRKAVGYTLLPMRTSHDTAGALAREDHIRPLLQHFYDGRRRLTIPPAFHSTREDIRTGIIANRALLAAHADPTTESFALIDELPPPWRSEVWQKLLEHADAFEAYEYASEALKRYPGAKWAVTALIRAAYELRSPACRLALAYLPAYLETHRTRRAEEMAKVIRETVVATAPQAR